MDERHDADGHHPPLEVGADDVAVRPRHTGHRWFDLIVALTAILISTVSLVVAIDHGRTERQLVLAASWPCIQEDTTLNDRTVAISIVNAGIGPAKMQWLAVYYQGTLVHDVAALLQRCCGVEAGPRSVIGRYVASFDTGNPNQQVLRAGERLRVLELADDRPQQHLVETLGKHVDEISFRGCYCSVFDECWIGNLNSLATQRVPSCPAEPGAFQVRLP